MKTIREDARDIPLLAEADVLVAGAGISGFAAALASARAGADTVLAERNGCLGGVATATMMANIGNFAILADGTQVVRGVAEELIERLAAVGAASPDWRRTKSVALDSERLKVVMIEMLEEAGVTILTHALTTRPIMNDRRVLGAFIESKSGRQAILAGNTVDATGEADILVQTPAEVESFRGNASLLFKISGCDLDRFVEFLGEDPDGFPQGHDRVPDYESFARTWHDYGALLFPHYGGKKWRFLQEAVAAGTFTPEIPPCYNLDVMGMYAYRDTGHTIINSTYYIHEELDIAALSRYETHAQKMCYVVGDWMCANVPGFEDARVEQIGVDLGLRGARRINGRFNLEEAHIRGTGDPVRFDDVIGTWPVRRKGAETAVFADETFDMPFGITVPQGATHILCGSGKSVSTDGGHNRLVRGMTGCMILGQATGVAAALGAAREESAGDVPVREIQTELLRQGACLGPPDRLAELGLA